MELQGSLYVKKKKVGYSQTQFITQQVYYLVTILTCSSGDPQRLSRFTLSILILSPDPDIVVPIGFELWDVVAGVPYAVGQWDPVLGRQLLGLQAVCYGGHFFGSHRRCCRFPSKPDSLLSYLSDKRLGGWQLWWYCKQQSSFINKLHI